MNTTNPQTPTVTNSKPSALIQMGKRFSIEPTRLLHTLKNTVFKGATDDECAALIVVANEHNLNPFLKEIYAFPSKGGITAIVGVDGWLRIINSHPNFDGVEFEQTDKECTCVLYVKGRAHPVKVTEYMAECRKNTEPWKTHPRRMLRHKALIQCARVAFGFSGIHEEDDAPQAEVVADHPASSTITVISPPEAETPPPSDTKEQARVPDPVSPPEDSEPTPQQELAALVIGAGHTFDDFQKWGVLEGVVPEAEDCAGFDDLPTKTACRLKRAKTGLLAGLAQMKEGKTA